MTYSWSYVYILVVAVSMFSSCASLIDTNTTHQIVTPSVKNSLQLVGGIKDNYEDGEKPTDAIHDKRYSYGLQVGYSPIQNIGLTANYYRPVTTINSTDGQFDSFGKSMDFALGTYWGKRNPHIEKDQLDELKEYYEGTSNLFMNYDQWFVDGYIGAGEGDLEMNFAFNGKKQVAFQYTFLQVGIHWRSGMFGADICSRITQTRFKSVLLSGDIPGDQKSGAFRLDESPNQLSSLTTARFQFGTSFFRLLLERNWRHNERNLDSYYLDYNKFQLALLLDFHGLFQYLKKDK